MMRLLLAVAFVGLSLAGTAPSATANPLVNDAIDIVGPVLPTGGTIGIGDIGPDCDALLVVGRCQSNPQSGP